MSSRAETFFDQLIECAKRDAARHPGAVTPEVLAALSAPARRPDEPRRPMPPHPPLVDPRPFDPAKPPQQQTPPRTPPGEPPEATLERMRLYALDCKRCPLAATRTNVVFGEGDPHAELMFIGEGPGADEDRLGRPFVGRAGQLLDKMIAAMQFKREEVYIANIVKCRPPGNRTPTPDEAARCIGYLERQIRFVAPKAIVLLGATAATFLLDRHDGITKLRGSWTEYKGIPVMPTYHPAFLLRQESAKREAWHDLQMVMAKFGKSPVQPPKKN